MVSPTKQTWRVRDNKKKNQGRARKNKLAHTGSTPTKEEMFRVVTPEAKNA
jgi:hypothetical protein